MGDGAQDARFSVDEVRNGLAGEVVVLREGAAVAIDVIEELADELRRAAVAITNVLDVAPDRPTVAMGTPEPSSPAAA